MKIELGGPVTAEATPEGQMAGELTYARAGGPVFEARTRLAESADRTPADWRALGLSAFEVHQVESATLQEGAAPISLTRAEPDWKRGDVKISYLPVSDLLVTLTEARADRIWPPPRSRSASRSPPSSSKPKMRERRRSLSILRRRAECRPG